MGQSCVALARLSGAGLIIAVGGPSGRLTFARRMGADQVIGLEVPPGDRIELVRESTQGRGVDVVIEAAGRPEAVSQALDLVRDGGRVVVVGQYTDHGPIEINPHWQINRKHVELRGVWGSDYSHFPRAVELAARFQDRVPWRELVSTRFPLDRAGEALAAVERQELLKAIIGPGL